MLQDELHNGIQQLTGKTSAQNNEVKLLTSCPSCQQGLARFENETGVKTDYIVVELANKILGEDWQDTFIRQVKAGGD